MYAKIVIFSRNYSVRCFDPHYCKSETSIGLLVNYWKTSGYKKNDKNRPDQLGIKNVRDDLNHSSIVMVVTVAMLHIKKTNQEKCLCN